MAEHRKWQGGSTELHLSDRRKIFPRFLNRTHLLHSENSMLLMEASLKYLPVRTQQILQTSLFLFSFILSFLYFKKFLLNPIEIKFSIIILKYLLIFASLPKKTQLTPSQNSEKNMQQKPQNYKHQNQKCLGSSSKDKR